MNNLCFLVGRQVSESRFKITLNVKQIIIEQKF